MSSSRRKIWSLPMALVTALLLVGLLGAVVLAQARNAAPEIASLDDIETRIGDDANTVNLAEEITDATTFKLDNDGDPNTADIDAPEQLAVTVMTDNAGRATIALAGNYNDTFAPAENTVAMDLDNDPDTPAISVSIPSAVAVWWDGLTDAERRDAVGARLIDNVADEVGDDELCDSTAWCREYDHDGDANTDAQDRIGRYVATSETINGNTVTTTALDTAQREIVTQAFHWDMLSAAEMVVVATAANLDDGNADNEADDYSAFEARFGGLTDPQRTQVDTLYTDTPAYLQRGLPAVLTVDESATADPGDDENDFKDGRIGEADITVKVSDSYGRLIPPASGSATVGESFTVDVQGTKLQQLVAPTVAPGPEDVRIIPVLDDDDEVISRKLRISGEAETVIIVSVQAQDDAEGTAQGIDGSSDSTRARLYNGSGLGLSVNPTGVRSQVADDGAVTEDNDNIDEFTIKLEDYSKLSDGGTFTFRAYALTEEVNWVEIDFEIELAVGNQAPEFAAGTQAAVAALSLSEDKAPPYEIYDFDATDPDHTTGISFRLSGDTTDVNGDVVFQIDNAGKLTVGPNSLDYQGDEEASGDDEEADDYVAAEDAGTNNENNIYELTITASDGELTSSVTSTITVTDSPDIPATGSRSFTINENTVNTVENAGEDNEESYLLDSDGAKASVLLLDSDGDPVPDGSTYEIDENNSPDDAVALFGINTNGSLFLKADQTLDFETEDRYLLSVKATDGNTDEVYTGAVIITIANVPEAPMFADDTALDLRVIESASVGDSVLDTKGTPDELDDVPAVVTAEDDDAGQTPSYSLVNSDDSAYTGGLFAIGAANGLITVAGVLDAEDDGMHSLKVKASDANGLDSYRAINILIGDANEAPNFETPVGGAAEVEIPEDKVFADGAIINFTATDPDRNDLSFAIREGTAQALFTIHGAHKTDQFNADDDPIWAGELRVADGVALDYDSGYNVATGYRVHIEVQDTGGLSDTLAVDITLGNVNDNSPVFGANADLTPDVAENTPRGEAIGEYPATDDDGDAVSYSLSGTNAKSFQIDGYGNLMTLESLDYDSNTPCPRTGCEVTIVASDDRAGSVDAELAIRISVTPVEDSVSTLNVTKANPVPGTTRGDPMTALGNTKTSMSDDVPERPAGLPNATGAPLNFVDTDWANWRTVLRIEVTAQSPDANCGSGNECVVISLNSDSADDTLKLEAYRMDTPAGAAASNENKFVAAVMLVELDGDATDIKDAAGNEISVFAHGDGSVARLQVDEEDEIEIEFYNLRGDVEVENEAPEISNFAPEHESAFDDPDVEYTFTVTDSHSGLPEPEDLPDVDGDDAYMPAVALISKGQCETADSDASRESKARRAQLLSDGFSIVEDMENISDDGMLYCPGVEQDGEYDASGAGYGFAPIRDDKDFDDIEDGFDVETTIVLRENRIFYVTFIACDNAGNCSFFDPDGNDDGEELAEITVDTLEPVFVEARTGLAWDSTDNEYDDNRSFIQVIFNDLTTLNEATVEIDDFVVEGHTIKDVHVFENPDSDDKKDGDWHARYGKAGATNLRGIARYRDIENSVFIELEDELLADETPDITIVPNGVEDGAGNEQDGDGKGADGEDADDWISPKFTIVSITSTLETSQDQVLAGDGDEVTVVVTSDERLDSTRPTVTVTYVNAPAGSIDTKGTALCDTDDGDDKGTRERGEIVHTGNDKCADSGAATGGNLTNSVERISNTEWIVTITEPEDTGYYNFRISGKDRSPRENPGSEGVSPGSIVTDFFDADGDVNVDDAIFFEGDINLPKPQVRVSGVSVEDNEADVEFRSPLFVELDFAANHSDNCRNVDTDERMANCMNENSEYAEDNFDDIVVTSFMLDGVDLTDSVKTTDNQSFLVSLESISIGDHTAEVQAVDQAGNVFEDTLEIDFEVNDRDPFEKRLSPGWNLVSLPGEPADSSIAAVFGPGVEVRTVYSYDPVIPGGWMVAVRETLDSDWQGDLTEINGQHGYWVLSDAIQDWEVSIPRLAGGASGTGTPIQPPVIPMYAGWNLIPVTDVSGNALSAGIEIDAAVYLRSLDDGLDLARVLGYDTIRNEWFTVLDMQMGSPGDLSIGSGYWVFVREAVALVPGGVAGVGGGD